MIEYLELLLQISLVKLFTAMVVLVIVLFWGLVKG